MTKLDNESGKQPHLGTAMTRREIAMLGCKILALWLFAQVAFFLAGILLMLILGIIALLDGAGGRSQGFGTAVATAIPALGALAGGLFCWYGASFLAGLMVSDDTAPVMRPDVSQADIMAVAFAAIGVFILVPVLRDFAASFVQIAMYDFKFSEWWADPEWQARFWSNVIGLAFAIWLILGSRGIVRVVLWARSAGASLGKETESS